LVLVKVLIKTVPSGALVTWNRKETGVSPVTFDAEVNTNYSYKPVLDGFETKEYFGFIGVDKPKTITRTLKPLIPVSPVEPEPKPKPTPEPEPVTEKLGVVKGYVVDGKGKPLQGVRIEVGGKAGSTAISGNYTLFSVPIGRQEVTASKTGFVTQKQAGYVTEPDVLWADFVMQLPTIEPPEKPPSTKPDFVEGFLDGLDAFLGGITTNPHVIAYEKFWADFAKDWGFNIAPPGQKPHFVILIGGGFVTSLGKAGVTKAVATSASKKIVQTAVSDMTKHPKLLPEIVKRAPGLLDELISIYPRKLADAFWQSGTAGRLAIKSVLTKSKAGRISLVEINKVLRKYPQSMLGAVKEKGVASAVGDIFANALAQIKKNPLLLPFVLTEIPQVLLMAVFARKALLEEGGKTGEQLSFRLNKAEKAFNNLSYLLSDQIKAGDTEAAKETIQKMRETVDVYNETIREGKTSLQDTGDYDIAKNLSETFELVVSANKEMLEETKPSVKATLTVETDQDPATVEIIGIKEIFTTPFTTEIEVANYDLVAEKTGYEQEARSFFIEENMPKRITIAFDRPIEGAEPNLGHLQATIKDYKTTASVAATLFVNDVAEKFHLSTHTVPLTQGIYEIRVEEAGYLPYSDTITIDEGEINIMEIPLHKIEGPEEEFEGVTCDSLGYFDVKPDDGKEYEQIVERGLTCWAFKKPGTGRVELTSEPEASVWIAGTEVVSKTPGTIELQQGFYDIKFKAEGYDDEDRRVVIKTGELTRQSVTLTPEEEEESTTRLPKITVNSHPTGAKILINGEWTDKYTPDHVFLNPGEYELSLTKTGYEQKFYALNLVEE